MGESTTVEEACVSHHVVGTSLPPGGVAHGCAHNSTEHRLYIDAGKLPNPDCEYVERWNRENRGLNQ